MLSQKMKRMSQKMNVSKDETNVLAKFLHYQGDVADRPTIAPEGLEDFDEEEEDIGDRPTIAPGGFGEEEDIGNRPTIAPEGYDEDDIADRPTIAPEAFDEEEEYDICVVKKPVNPLLGPNSIDFGR